jgi:hypothetical protein
VRHVDATARACSSWKVKPDTRALARSNPRSKAQTEDRLFLSRLFMARWARAELCSAGASCHEG